jgi:hypothetical protein
MKTMMIQFDILLMFHNNSSAAFTMNIFNTETAAAAVQRAARMAYSHIMNKDYSSRRSSL